MIPYHKTRSLKWRNTRQYACFHRKLVHIKLTLTHGWAIIRIITVYELKLKTGIVKACLHCTLRSNTPKIHPRYRQHMLKLGTHENFVKLYDLNVVRPFNGYFFM